MDINGRTLEYIDEGHIYLVDGVVVPSITQILKHRFGKKYDFVNPDVLKKAADKGTAVHEAIEMWCREGIPSDLPEVRNFEFLKKKYGFEVVENEVPVILERDGEPIAAGRLDLVLKMDGHIGGADIKRTSSLDKEYVAYQLNLYRIAYRQCYGVEWKFLRAVHLREDTRKFVALPINEKMAWKMLDEFTEANNES